jgi:hypothetical protein
LRIEGTPAKGTAVGAPRRPDESPGSESRSHVTHRLGAAPSGSSAPLNVVRYCDARICLHSGKACETAAVLPKSRMPSWKIDAVVLDPSIVAEIEAQAAVLGRGPHHDAFARKLTNIALAEERAHATFHRNYREARDAALEAGDPNPHLNATLTAMRLRELDRYHARVDARFREIKRENLVRRNRAAAKVEKASSSAKPRRRRFLQKDHAYLRIIGSAEKDERLGDAASVVREIEKTLTRYRLPHWEKTTLPLKALACSLESSKAGAQTINLRPNHETCHKALQSPRGAAAYMEDRIKRALEDKFGMGNVPDFWFVIESDTHERFHVHGAVVTPKGIADAEDTVDDALRAAGGLWSAPGGHQHQQVHAPLRDPAWWASYACKELNVTADRLGIKNTFAATYGMRRAARVGWDGHRAVLPQLAR